MLLFSKDTFSAELKELLGFVDADIRFNRMKPSVEIATDEIIDLVGRQVYLGLLEDNRDEEFYALVKYAIALKGYMLYAPTADLSVTNNGRLMRRDEHTVSAFEWQIEANDEALENLYYRHLDRLLRYMVAGGIKINLEKYNHSDLIVPSLEAFESFYPINGSHYLYLKLLPALKEFEQNELLPRMGKFLEDRQKLEREGIWYLLQSSSVKYAMAWGLKRLNLQLFPKGVVQVHKSNAKTQKKSSDKEHWETAVLFEKEVENLLLKIEEKMSKFSKNDKQKISSQSISLDVGFSEDDGFVDL